MQKEAKPGYKFCTGKHGCGKELPLGDFWGHKPGKLGRRTQCKQCYKKFYTQNKDKILKYQKEYRKQNKDKKSKWNKTYADQNKDKASEYFKEYHYSPASYALFASRLVGIEEIRQDKDGLLICFCKYCGFPFAPTNIQVRHRIASINGTGGGQSNLYCSDECKAECPSYWTQWHSRDQKVGTSREVPASFRKIALEDRDWTCENCGSTEKGLHVHHIEGVVEQPMFAADLCNVRVVCKACHLVIHSKPGCTFNDYQCAGREHGVDPAETDCELG